MQSREEYQEISNFLSKYTIIPQTDECMLIKSHQNSYLSKKIQLDSKITDIDNVQETLEQHQTLNQNYILTLLNYHFQSLPQSTFINVKTLYQYASLNLKEEIDNRREDNLHFKEEQLWAIVYSVIKALEYLEKLNIGYGVLGCDKIFIDKRFKLIDPSAIAEDPLTLGPFRLYSPEIIEEQQNIDILKSDVFVLGLCILEAVLLTSLSSDDLPKYDETRLKIYIEQAEGIYGAQLSTLLKQMLEYSPEDRPNFSEIRQYLENTLELIDESDSYFSPLPPDSQDIPNNLELDDQTQELQICDIQEENQSCSFTASLNEFQKAKLIFLDSSPEIQGTIKNLSSINEDSKYTQSILPEFNLNLDQPKSKPTKSIKEKVVKNTNNLQLEVIEVAKSKKIRQPVLQAISSKAHNHLFTNPKLLQEIQNDLKMIVTNRSSHPCKENYPFCNF